MTRIKTHMLTATTDKEEAKRDLSLMRRFNTLSLPGWEIMHELLPSKLVKSV